MKDVSIRRTNLDFTLNKYDQLCNALYRHGYTVSGVADYLNNPNPGQKVAVLRHDVDRKSRRVLQMARLEQKRNIRSTYYFRFRRGIFQPKLIAQVASMGHEIGYHYEALDKANGVPAKAIRIFEDELARFRKIAEIKTICMHGNPLTRWDNRTLWDKYNFTDFGLTGEAYLSLHGLTYFSDSSRRWESEYKFKDFMIPSPSSNGNKNNAFASITDDIIEIIEKEQVKRLYIVAHPERWSNSLIDWIEDYILDSFFNIGRAILRCIERFRPVLGRPSKTQRRILFDIGHPAHVHFFKNVIRKLEAKGYEIAITSREKDVTTVLLDHYGFKHQVLSQAGKTPIGLIKEMLIRDYRLYQFVRKFKPDLLISWASIAAAHVSILIRKPYILFEDNEPAWEQQILRVPFSRVICTSTSYKKDFGKRQLRYNSYEELAYLHPGNFQPDPSVLRGLGLKDTEDRLIILRFVNWKASHDIGESGFNFHNESEEIGFIKGLERYGRVFITSEGKLSPALDAYRKSLPPEKMHDLLYYAQMYIGEGATMAAEAAVLGTPSIYVSSISLGYINELRDRYGLVRTCEGFQSALTQAIQLLGNPNAKHDWQDRKRKMLQDKIDLTDFMINLIEGYPRSVDELRKIGKDQRI